MASQHQHENLMKIFLHIGMPKTGSTTIQRTLRLNKARLADNGVYYPYRTDALYGLVAGSGPAAKLSVPKRCNTVIISDERLFNRVRSPAQAQTIVDSLRAISPNVRLISYVRREDEVFVSAYFTRLLMGSSEKLEELPLQPVQTYRRLSSWNDPVGLENMIVRRFGQAYLPDGLVADFAKVVGIEHLHLEREPNANTSPRTDVLEIIRLLNATRHDREVNREASKAVARAIGFGDAIGLSADDRKRLIQNAAEQNRRLSECYFGGEDVFSHPLLDNEPRWPEIEVQDLARVGERMASMHGVAITRTPTGLDQALTWIRSLAEKCARVPRRNRAGATVSLAAAAPE